MKLLSESLPGSENSKELVDLKDIYDGISMGQPTWCVPNIVDYKSHQPQPA